MVPLSDQDFDPPVLTQGQFQEKPAYRQAALDRGGDAKIFRLDH